MSRLNFKRPMIWRLFVALLVIPLLVPVLIATSTRHDDGSRSSLNDYLTNLLIMGPVTFAAMVVLGLPLLWVYIRFHLTSMVAFGLGGGVCAAITGAVMNGPPHMASVVYYGLMLVYYGLYGVVAGVVFRVILFGLGRADRVDT